MASFQNDSPSDEVAVPPNTDNEAAAAAKNLEKRPKPTQPDGSTGAELSDFSHVATTHWLSSGNYTVGIDIPAGKFVAVAKSGFGNLFCYTGDVTVVSEFMGYAFDESIITGTLGGIELEEGSVVTVTGELELALHYSKVTSDVTGRSYGNVVGVTLGVGTYTAGVDFEPGTYNISAVSGEGGITSSNGFRNGIDEGFFGYSSAYPLNTSFVQNVDLYEGVKLTISGSLEVALNPEIKAPSS
ncbi:MAG: hypothetical protein LBU48_05125 [Coriobacteriales bacterium]|jgi:hypothetical protein|nr:hypothetical protein [Coriobacteriales bacterium]